MGCSNQNENQKNNAAPIPSNYNLVNVDNKFSNIISCPSCGEPLGNNFKSSGNDTQYYDCFKCGNRQSGKNYYGCKKCNSVFCYKCPQLNHDNFISCPFCGEVPGNNFKGSGFDTQYYDCFNCGNRQSGSHYYECKKCNCVFCYKCPQLNNNNKFISCPSCGETFGNNFKGSRFNTQYFDCFNCGNRQSGSIYFGCKKCNCVFCYKCPQLNNKNKFLSCPTCGETFGNNFKGSGFDTQYFNCFKCGSRQSGSNYYKCKKCNCMFCDKCPFYKN